jgi:hypothetical protein
MAKKIYNHNGEFAHYAPGVIYDIGVIDPTTKTRTPFYVGETSDPEARLKAHARAGKNADDESTLVYQTIRALDEAGIEWNMETLAEFDKEGPTDLEDEWIMKHLYSGYRLKNMKKGNANWMAERESCAADMRRRSISSYRKYREVLSIEEKQAEADRKHALWLKEEELRKIKEEQRREQYEAQQRAEEVRLKLQIEMAERRVEQVRKEAEKAERDARLKAEAAAKWEADRPAREAKLKAEAEAFQAREEQRLRELHERKAEEERRARQSRDEFIAQADIDQAVWPEHERVHHQRIDNQEWTVISRWPKEMQERQKELDRIYHEHTLAK